MSKNSAPSTFNAKPNQPQRTRTERERRRRGMRSLSAWPRPEISDKDRWSSRRRREASSVEFDQPNQGPRTAEQSDGRPSRPSPFHSPWTKSTSAKNGFWERIRIPAAAPGQKIEGPRDRRILLKGSQIAPEVNSPLKDRWLGAEKCGENKEKQHGKRRIILLSSARSVKSIED